MALETLIPGCFGKLPAYPDYLEHNLRLPTCQTLKRWIERGRWQGMGVDQAEQDDLPSPMELRSYRFLVGLPGSAELLAGVIRPSTDFGRRRSFPFTVFAPFPRQTFHRQVPLIPLALAGAWQALEETWELLAGLATPEMFREMLTASRIPPPVPVKIARATFQARVGGDTGYLDAAVGEPLGDWLAHRIPRVVASVRDGAAGPFAFPISGDPEESCFEASFWITLLDRHFFWRRMEPCLFLETTPGNQNRAVFLLFQFPPEELYRPLLCLPPPEAGSEDPGEVLVGDRPPISFDDLLKRRFRKADSGVRP